MIRYLFGEIVSKDIDSVTLDVNNIGYGVAVSASDYGQLKQGNKVKLFIHEHIREDAYDLYGFVTITSKQLFNQLLSVKNVGPKVALAVLSIGSEDVVRRALAAGDIKLLQSAKGVGKRAAEQMIVELRDKVGLLASDDAESIVTRGGVITTDEAVQALMSLGYSDVDAQLALSKVDSSLPTEQRVTHALKGSK